MPFFTCTLKEYPKGSMNILLLNVTSGYPEQFSANNAKAEFVSRGLMENGAKVVIVNDITGSAGADEMTVGISEVGIKYYTFPRKNGHLSWMFNAAQLVVILKKEREKKGKDIVILGMNLYPVFLLSVLVSCLLGYKRVALFHEWHVGINGLRPVRKLEAWIKDRTFGYFLNGILPISAFLEDRSMRFRKKMLRLPVLGNFSDLSADADASPADYVVYCAHAGYLRIVEFVIDSYAEATERGFQGALILVLHGNREQVDGVVRLVEQRGLSSQIEIKYNLSRTKLTGLYRNALGLLIPLDPDSLQDVARFSQKIAEYVASGRPIITSPTGEIPFYFEHKKNALIVPFSVMDYADVMVWLSGNPQKANAIGLGGREIGMKFFDYRANGQRVLGFIESL